MIEAIEGILVKKENLKAYINVGGIIFEVIVPFSTFNRLPALNKNCTLFVELVIGEKSLKLYGFLTKDEKTLFNELRKISKIGSQTAISILSSISIEQFYKAVEEQNKEILMRIPGVGKKTALSIIVELSSKLPQLNKQNTPQIAQEATEALKSLGFSEKEASHIVMQVYEKNPSITIEELLKESLKYFKNGN
ncbi:Holliday junction branch migration protein RuvA [Hippea jasoniae]|uniref:Holliday junction branch migration protein RuvA n=1 Tax=Hippea jasoniae TaxID=944479 RepID=UPI00054D3C17|nr:Holliday junction branch migration protein RuvA [Hippea jasoniae]